MRFGAWLLRATASLHTALLCAQPLLIGMFLSGDFSKLEAHAAVGGVILVTGVMQVVGAVAAWRLSRWSAWPISISAAMVVAETAQLAAGYTRQLALHVPLGVGLVGAGLALAVWAWRPRRRAPSATPLPPPPPPRWTP